MKTNLMSTFIELIKFLILKKFWMIPLMIIFFFWIVIIFINLVSPFIYIILKVNIIGISCFYHDSAAAYVKDGDISAAQERFTRIKHDNYPFNAIIMY